VCFAEPGAADCSTADGASAVLVGGTPSVTASHGWRSSSTATPGVRLRHDALAKAPAVDVPRAVDVLLVQV
jgi:hypothetical protein